jgi:hypothetical protein
MAMRLSAGDMFCSDWTTHLSKHDKSTLDKLQRGIDNCNREDFES